MKKGTEHPLDRASFLWVAAAVLASLLPVLPGFPAWLGVLLFAIAALGIGMGLRRRRLPAAIRMPLTLAVAAAAVASSGFNIGQETGAALLAAMLSTKLLETGSVRDGRSACSFALFAVMAGFLHDQGPTTLLLALIACTIIIAALSRLARVQLPGLPLPPSRPGKALLTSARLLAISLPFAFVVFFLFPRFPEPMWGAPGPDERSPVQRHESRRRGADAARRQPGATGHLRGRAAAAQRDVLAWPCAVELRWPSLVALGRIGFRLIKQDSCARRAPLP